MREDADILWVDDDLFMERRIIDEIRETFSATITFASTIPVAKSKLDKGDFKIVILDMLIDGKMEGGLIVLRYMSEQADANPLRLRPAVIIRSVKFDTNDILDESFPNFDVYVVSKLEPPARYFIKLIES